MLCSVQRLAALNASCTLVLSVLFHLCRQSSVPASLYPEMKERINIDPIEELRAGGVEEAEEKVEEVVVEGGEPAEVSEHCSLSK